MPAAADEALQLLLTAADEYIPVLADGFAQGALDGAPRPERSAGSAVLEAPGADPNDLPAQRWGVVAPIGEAGDRMLAAVDALVQHRRAQQGAEPKIYRVRPDMDVVAAIRWRNDVYRAEDVPEDERPRYLMLLGDLHEVSIELQHVLAGGALVGRLQCEDLGGFRQYAEKVVTAELAEAVTCGRAIYYSAEDSTRAVALGYERLIEPCLQQTREWSHTGRLAVSSVREVPPCDGQSTELLREAAAVGPAVMLSLSHGLGAPPRGWRTPKVQRERQGTLFLGTEELGASEIREATFLPGGVWMCVACFSAGTPSASAYAPWLSTLAAGGQSGASEVLRSLPREGERPFVAALPQAALANPRGPLAVIGHIDLAWTFGFSDAQNQGSRASRMFSTLRTLLEGARAGVALDGLMRTYRDTNDDLTSRYQRQRAAAAREQPDPEDPRQLGRLWMQRNDLRGYVLLGDPAARLGVKPQPAATREEPRESVAREPEAGASAVVLDAAEHAAVLVDPPTIDDSAAAGRERAVLGLLHGDEAPRTIAMRHGVTVAELFVWLDRYRAAGRCGLVR
jgi:hypothetical protein